MADQAHGTALLGARVRRRLPAIVDDLMERQWREVPEFFVTDDPAYVAAVRRGTSENAELMLAALDRPGAIPRALPPGPRLEAEVAAQHGAEVGALVRTYRLGQQTMVEHLIEDLDREGRDLLPPSVDVLREATRTIYVYMKAVIPLVAGEYDAERERLAARPDLGRLRRVQAFLAGDDTEELGYPVDGPHVAIVGALAPDTALSVAGQMDAAALAVRGPDERCWAWFGTARLDELRERLGETATALGIAPRTVTYRLRRAEGLLGHTIAERRAELEAALRLHRLFGPER